MGESVLIFTPTWRNEEGSLAMQPECQASIEAQTGVDVEWRIGTDNPYPIGDHRNVLHQYQQAREVFLQGAWDALLTVEHDNALPDPEAIRRLLDTPGHVVYAPYVLRHHRMRLSTWRYVGRSGLGPSLSSWPKELAKAREKVVWRVSGTGMGCTLFRRWCVQAIPFAPSNEGNPCPDLGFAEKALRKSLLSNGRFDVPVRHWHEGVWLEPW
jgi:hypothetical protein